MVSIGAILTKTLARGKIIFYQIYDYVLWLPDVYNYVELHVNDLLKCAVVSVARVHGWEVE